MNITKLCFGGDRIDLTHVTSFILLLYIVYMKKPCSMFVMFIVCDADTRISSDYVIVNGQNGRLFEMDPRHL